MQKKKVVIISAIITILLLISGCGVFGGGGIVDSGSQGSAVTDGIQGYDFDAMRTHAVFSGRNFEYLKECVENGVVDVNKLIPSDEGTHQEVSPLSLAPMSPYPHTEYLLQKGADPNVVSEDMTFLMRLTGDGGIDDASVGEIYIRYGADVNARNADGHSALYNAVKFGRTDYVKLLLENGAEITQEDIDMMEFSVNTFFVERAADEQDISRWDKEADAFYTIPAVIYDAAEKQGTDAKPTDVLLQAVLNNDLESVIFGVQAGGVTDVITYLAAAYCKPDVMEYLVSQGVDTGVMRDDDMNLLWMAAAAGNLDVVRYLVENGASINNGDYENDLGYSEFHPLISAISNDHMEVVRYLLENGFELNMELERGPDEQRERATGKMMIATAASGNPDFIPLLKEHGYVMDENIGYWGLFYAISEHQDRVLEALLKEGVDPNYIDLRFGAFTLIEECTRGDLLEAMKLLIQYGGNIQNGNTDALNYAAKYASYEVMEYMLDEGMPVDACYGWGTKEEGYRAIFSAIDAGYLDKVKLLVERGADVNDPVEAPLVWAAGTSRNILEYLIDAGADVNLREAGGRTALMMAAANNNVINIQILLDAGADKTLKDAEGKTAYDYAKENDAKEAMQMLE